MAKKAYIGVDGKARKIKKGYIGVENFVPRALPSGYTQLSHIESTGAQAFDTGVAHSSSDNIVLQVEVSYTSIGSAHQLMGFTGNAGNAIGLYNGAWWEATSLGNATVGTRYAIEWGVSGTSWHRTVNGKTVTGTRSTYSYSSNMYLFAARDSATSPAINYFCFCKSPSAKVILNGTLIRDYVPCINPSGVVGLYDMVNGTFGGSATSTPFVAGDTYNSFARKIKKAYIGIGGVARPCWSGGEVAYYGTIAGLGTAVMAHSATSNGTHAIFAGGAPSGATATAYDASLTQTFPAYFDSMYLSSASAAGYSIFGFGVTNSSGSELTTAQRYDSSLTLTSHSGRQKRKVPGATSIGEFVIFAGGGYGNAATTQNVEVFHAPSMTNGSLTQLNYPSYYMGAATIGDYAIFAGGADAQVNASRVKYVVAYDLSTTKTNLPDLSVARNAMGSASVGDYALFAGGNAQNSSSNVVDAYNKSLTRTSAPTLSAAWSEMGATTLGGFAIFAGGAVSGSGRTSKAECYDASLTRTSLTSLSMSRYDVKAATIGNYALFGGGNTGNYQSVVDAYTIA